MVDISQAQARMTQLRAARESAAANARAFSLRADGLKAELDALRRVAPRRDKAARGIAALERRIAGLEHQADAAREAVGQARNRFEEERAVFVRTDMDALMAGMGDHLPFLLFPVRLETKFAHAGGTQLRVRIFPDDILISSHDPLLTASERSAGKNYWQERARAALLEPNERRIAERGAWSLLAARHGGPRARYIARQMKPSDGVGPGDANDGPEAAPVRSSAAPPRSTMLPDFFKVMAFDENNRIVAEAVGKPIADTLMLGPDPEAAAAELDRDPNERLAADPKLAWLIDYDSAIDAGMAVTLAVPEAFARIGFRRVIALGTRLSQDPESTAGAVEQLFSDHRYTQGIDILPQGSPTNNTDGASSAFTTALSADEALIAQEIDGAIAIDVLDHDKKTDAQRLSEALGISLDAIADWPSACSSFDIADALAMNRALWPATIGTFLDELVGQRMAAPLKAAIEQFFLTYVTGRGLLPAIRVGAQPYGVLVSSDLKQWREDPGLDNGGSEMTEIVSGIARLRERFEPLLGDVAQMGRGDDPLAMTLRVTGQLASSASFASRKAVFDEWGWNTLVYQGVMPILLANWYQTLQGEKASAYDALGIATTGLKLAGLTFLQSTDPWNGPIVDRDPAVPLSETAGIAPFDGARNYIQWLLAATSDQLRAQAFTNAEGDAIAPPTALLYRLLYRAWSKALLASASGLITRLHPELVAEARFLSMANLGSEQTAPEAQAPFFDAARLGLAANSRALGDVLLDASITSAPVNIPEALALLTQRESLERLATRPTAVLERILAEHVGLTSYRLDAWQTGLAARRLDLLRRRDGRARGVYVGAYGYVEDLQPKPPPRAVDPATLPESLRSSAPVTEQAANGGYVHAPSLTHAVTAAVLRNAYLTHADSNNAGMLSINLTSRRVRAAMGFIEGIRAGQELAALLGYQFERGLHDGYPGVELDTYIYVLRARFPLVSGRLTATPTDAPAEVIEARNVVDGYDLLAHVRGKAYSDFGIAGLPAEGSPAAGAILAEIERLEATLDAIADLMTAETVHQTIQSNMDRARGVIGTLADGDPPAVAEVVQTPRSGRVLTQRLVLHLPDAGGGWTSPATPRAEANPRLNAWLAAQLPPPARIGFQVLAVAATSTVTLADSGLDAIDVVLMSGDRFGDGSSELERWLADRWLADHNIGDTVRTAFSGPLPAGSSDVLVVELATAAGMTPLAVLLPQVRALRRLIGGARGLTGQDFRLPSEIDKVVAANPKGTRLKADGDVDHLPERIQAAHARLTQAADGLAAVLADLKPAYDALPMSADAFDPTPWTPRLPVVRDLLRTIALHGLAEAEPRSSAGVSSNIARFIYEQGVAIGVAVGKRLESADALLAPLPAEPPRDNAIEEARRLAGRIDRRLDNLTDAARQILGASFPLQPVFDLDGAQGAEIGAALADPIETDPLRIEGWLQSLARVRAPLADLALATAAAQWTTGEEPRLVPVQLPKRAGDPWIGAGWTGVLAAGDIMSVMTIDPPTAFTGGCEGLILDEWTETVPTPTETTGYAFHFDRPSAAAPQALLVATPPNPDGLWQWNELVGTVIDTFDRARMRAIEPDQIAASPLFPILPAAMLPFSSGRLLGSQLLAETANNANLVRK